MSIKLKAAAADSVEDSVEALKKEIEKLKKQLEVSQAKVRAQARKLTHYALQNVDYNNVEFKTMVNRERRLGGSRTETELWAEYINTRFATYLGNMGVDPLDLLNDIRNISFEKTGESTPLTVGELVQEANWESVQKYDWIFTDPYNGLVYHVTFDYYTHSFIMQEVR